MLDLLPLPGIWVDLAVTAAEAEREAAEVWANPERFASRQQAGE